MRGYGVSGVDIIPRELIADLKNIVLKQQRLIGVKHGGGELQYVAPLKRIGENSGNLTRVSEWGPSWS